MVRKKNIEKFSKLEKNPDFGEKYILTLHNDDIHDFYYVIESLIEICNHDSIQAEQCTYIVHYKGSCEIKRGSYDHLSEMYRQLCEKELIVTLSEVTCH